jgi:uncharacterized protein
MIASVHIMARRPACGVGKRRLAAEIGAVQALRWQNALLIHTIRQSFDERWQTHLHLANLAGHVLRLPRPVVVHRQGGGSLGERLFAAMKMSKGAFVMIGSDCPGLHTGHIATAFRRLRRLPWVVGPARDGGFWLIGAGQPMAAIADPSIRWSHSETLVDVIRALGDLGPPALLPVLHDIDCAADLKR